MFRQKLQELCSSAHLRADMTAGELWFHVWKKIRCPDWCFDPAGKAHGEAVREFPDKTGRFAGIGYNKPARKLRKILTAAAAFRDFPPGAQALAALFGDDYDEPGDEALWRAHERLARQDNGDASVSLVRHSGAALVNDRRTLAEVVRAAS